TASVLPPQAERRKGRNGVVGEDRPKGAFLLAVPESGTGYPEIAAAGARRASLFPRPHSRGQSALNGRPPPLCLRAEDRTRGAEGRKARPGPRKSQHNPGAGARRGK